MNKNIGFIGAGNMAQAIMGGLLKAGLDANNISIYEPNQELAKHLMNTLGVNLSKTNVDLVEKCDVIVLAVKPQVMQTVLKSLQGAPLKQNAFFISVAAGLQIDLMQDWLGASHPMVRVMPNIAALVAASISGLYASKQVDQEQQQLAESIIRSVGSVIWLDKEALINTVTAVSGSGPAYFFYFIEALEQAAIDNGLSIDQARLLSLETAFGAAKLALESDVNAATLRQRVTSPGGTTEAALEVFQNNTVDETISEAVNNAIKRAQDLSEQTVE